MSDADFDFEAEPLPVTGVGTEIVPVGKKAAGPRPCNEEGKCVVCHESRMSPKTKYCAAHKRCADSIYREASKDKTSPAWTVFQEVAC